MGKKTQAVPTEPNPATAAKEKREQLLASGLEFKIPDTSQDEKPTKDRILDTAITLSGERGFEACTMRELAAEVGIKAPAIYNHFSSKDMVLGAAMQHILGHFFASILKDLDEVPPGGWLEIIVRRHILFQLQHPRLSRANDALMSSPAIENNLPSDVYRRIIKVERLYVELVRSCIEVQSPGCDPRVAMMAAFGIMAMCDRVADWYDPSGPFDVEQIAERHWHMISRMIAADAES